MLSSYEQTLQCNTPIEYIGPKSLFDPNFVPSKIIPRKKQARMLHGIVIDALEDEYNVNLNLYGLKGAGKNLQMNHFFRWLKDNRRGLIKESQDALKPLNTAPFYLAKVNCERKDVGHVFFEIVQQMFDYCDLSLKMDALVNATPGKLWKLFQLSAAKHLLRLQGQKNQKIPLLARH